MKHIRNEVFSFIDEFEDHDFFFANDFTSFKLIKNNSVINYDDNDDDENSFINFKF